MKVIEIEGIGKKYSLKLGKAGYVNVEDLSKLTVDQINELAKKIRISPKLVDKWQEQADLMALKGIGAEFAEVLNKIGIDSVKELSRRNSAKILEKVQAFDKRRPNVIRNEWGNYPQCISKPRQVVILDCVLINVLHSF